MALNQRVSDGRDGQSSYTLNKCSKRSIKMQHASLLDKPLTDRPTDGRSEDTQHGERTIVLHGHNGKC